jgi:hypothetical protein
MADEVTADCGGAKREDGGEQYERSSSGAHD